MLQINRAMPKTCNECFCHDAEYNVCQAAQHTNLASEDTEHRPGWCPLKEVILCKDCRHWEKIFDYGILPIGTCEMHDKGLMTMSDGFCKWAVRKDNDANALPFIGKGRDSND